MDEEEFPELDNDSYTTEIMPFVRIYISAGTENHDLLEIDEIIDWLSTKNSSISETIKDLLDQGMANVYACSFDRTVKVL